MLQLRFLLILLATPIVLYCQHPSLSERLKGFDAISLRYAGISDKYPHAIIILTHKEGNGHIPEESELPTSSLGEYFYLVDRKTFGEIVQLLKRTKFPAYHGSEEGTFLFSWPEIFRRKARSVLVNPEIISNAFTEIAGRVDEERYASLKSDLLNYAKTFEKEPVPDVKIW